MPPDSDKVPPDKLPPDKPPVDEVAVAQTLLAAVIERLGGEPRAGQQEMVTAVEQAIADGQTLLVQAGTGTGKSLGYLVPAACRAVLAGERIVIATATLALQRQLLTHDLPLVAAASAGILPREVTFCLLKGRQNYVCKYKLAGGYPIDDQTLFDDQFGTATTTSESEQLEKSLRAAKSTAGGRKAAGSRKADSFPAQVKRVREWAESTDTGDRDDLIPGVSDRAWRQVSISALECLGNKCPLLAECFSESARNAAKEVDIVVTNHAMLGIAANGNTGVLPDYQVLVVDEAHNLEAAVISGAIIQMSLPVVERTSRAARTHLKADVAELDRAGKAFAKVLADLPDGKLDGAVPDILHDAIVAIRDATRGIMAQQAGQPATTDGAVKVAQSALLQAFEVAERLAEPGDTDVLWVARSDDSFSRLFAGPHQVAGLIHNELIEDAASIFTSATLTLGGSFASVAKSLGLAPGTYQAVDVGSPFDYPKQGILYVAAHLPKPGRDSAIESQLEEIEALVKAAGGRTLGLFSSRAAAQAAALAMRERLDTPVLLQGDDQLPTLIAQFAEDPATCLFGTYSLWQGVDVPGSSCQLVIIDKLGFPRPDDPISSAQVQAAYQAGGNGFMEVAATHSALRLAQAAGRLIRRTSDRGVVAVLDSRLATERYGSFLARSLPPFWRTSDRQTVLDALSRLNDAAIAAEDVSVPRSK